MKDPTRDIREVLAEREVQKKKKKKIEKKGWNNTIVQNMVIQDIQRISDDDFVSLKYNSFIRLFQILN